MKGVFMKNNLTIGASQVPLYPDEGVNNQVVSSWVADTSSSLLNKMWGYQVQTRITFLPKEVQIQEVASSRFERVWQELYGKISTLWAGKPQFTVSVFADTVIPADLDNAQVEHLKSILKSENVAVDSMDEWAVLDVVERMEKFLKSVGGDVKQATAQISSGEDDIFSRQIQRIKSSLPRVLEVQDKQWEASKDAIQVLAKTYFKKNPSSLPTK